jgi:hypothetical protein
MTLYGSRDFEGPQGAAVTYLSAGTPTLTRGSGRTEPGPDGRRILLRVQGGDDIVVGLTGDRDEGVELARRMMRLIDTAEAHGEWPELDDRFIRPGAIVSIDVQRAA